MTISAPQSLLISFPSELKIAFAYSLPVFITPTLSILNGSNCSSSPLAFPAGLFIIFLLSAFKLFTLPQFAYSFRPYLCSIFLPFLCLLFFLPFNLFEPELVLVYLLPMLLAYFSMNLFLSSVNSFLVFLDIFAFSLGIFSCTHIFSSFISLGPAQSFLLRGDCNIFGFFSIYQVYIYYPLLLSFAFIILLFSNNPLRPLSGIILFALFVDILLCSSRESFLIVLTSFLVKIVRHFAFGGWRLSLAISFLFLFISFIVYVLLPSVFFDFGTSDSMLLQKLQTVDFSDAESFTGGRLGAFNYVFGNLNFTAPFFLVGTSFSSTIFGRETPHNQYAEWFLRGGVILAIPMFCILFTALFRSFKLFLSDKQFFATFLILFATVIISCNLNTPFRAPYSSGFLWFVIFAVLKIYSFSRFSGSRPADWRRGRGFAVN